MEPYLYSPYIPSWRQHWKLYHLPVGAFVLFRYNNNNNNNKHPLWGIYSLTQLFVKQLLLKIFHIIFHSYMFRLVSMEPSSGWALKKVLYTTDNVLLSTRSCITFSKILWNKLSCKDAANWYSLNSDYFILLLAINFNACYLFDSHLALFNDISIVNPCRCTNVSSLFRYNTLHVSDGLSVHHQQFKTVHTATGICQIDTAVWMMDGKTVRNM